MKERVPSARIVGTNTRLRRGWHAVARQPRRVARKWWVLIAKGCAGWGFMALVVFCIYGVQGSCSEGCHERTITGYILVDYDGDGDISDCLVLPAEMAVGGDTRTDACNGTSEHRWQYYESDGSRRNTRGWEVYAITNEVTEDTMLRRIHMPPDRCRRIGEVEEPEEPK